MNNNEGVRLVYCSSNVCDAAKAVYLEPHEDKDYYSFIQDAWAFQEGEDIIIKMNNGKDKEVCRIKGKKLYPFVPASALQASIFAPGAYSYGFRRTYGFKEEVEEFRQGLIKELLNM